MDKLLFWTVAAAVAAAGIWVILKMNKLFFWIITAGVIAAGLWLILNTSAGPGA
ncbi:MAG: hypothetical protein OEM91_10850 [Hyphomicrobiales bacterium]|nr:hypothetical protein [Hyphomicrobiales bacterium]